MSTPTFDGTALTSTSERALPGQPQVRLSAASLPNVDGVLVSFYGNGARRWVGTGYLSATGASAAVAHAALITALLSKQALADGRTSGSYVHTDGTTYVYSVLLSYNAIGPVEHEYNNGTYTARVRVRYEVLETSP